MAAKGKYLVTDLVVVLTRQRSLPFLHVLPTLVEDLLDIVGGPIGRPVSTAARQSDAFTSGSSGPRRYSRFLLGG